MSKKTSAALPELFAAVERRLTRELPGPWPAFRAQVCGHTLELRFDTPQHARNTARGLRGRLTETAREPDAVFKYWVDDCARYIGPEHAAARWQICGAAGRFTYIAGTGFTAEDKAHHTFYCCHPRQSRRDPTAYTHGMYRTFSQWGRSVGLLMVHAAAVGTKGGGVLLVGRGGAGKSTLAAACLLAGLDCVGDDYVMLTGRGAPAAMPVYSSVCLNRDMAPALRADMPLLWERESGKLELDASRCLSAGPLPVKALVAPALGGTPGIAPMPAGAAAARATASTVKQMAGLPDPGLVKAITDRLAGLPAFTFRVGEDPLQNAVFLRNFIEKEL